MSSVRGNTVNPFTTGESVSEIINKYAQNMDLIILGHRKMNTFKSHIMDSIDEGISNLVTAPVLIVQKN